jgi:hypothetical protein
MWIVEKWSCTAGLINTYSVNSFLYYLLIKKSCWTIISNFLRLFVLLWRTESIPLCISRFSASSSDGIILLFKLLHQQNKEKSSWQRSKETKKPMRLNNVLNHVLGLSSTFYHIFLFLSYLFTEYLPWQMPLCRIFNHLVFWSHFHASIMKSRC